MKKWPINSHSAVRHDAAKQHTVRDCFGAVNRAQGGVEGSQSVLFSANFQSRIFWLARENKNRIFACRFFRRFLISRRWPGAKRLGVNKL
jgi:hypothetical protein